MSRFSLFAGLAVLGSTIVVGCGGDDDDSSGTGGASLTGGAGGERARAARELAAPIAEAQPLAARAARARRPAIPPVATAA
jgi:hypothetical protein